MKKITLRKAHSVEVAIKAALNRVSTNSQVGVSIFDETPTVSVQNSRKDVLANIETVDRLTKIRNGLRKAIMIANASKGINELIAEDAELANIHQRYTKLAGATVAITDTQLVSQITAQKARSEKTDYYRGDLETLTVGVLTQEDIDGFAKITLAASRRRTEIADELLVANTTATVSISEEDYEYLQTQAVI